MLQMVVLSWHFLKIFQILEIMYIIFIWQFFSSPEVGGFIQKSTESVEVCTPHEVGPVGL